MRQLSNNGRQILATVYFKLFFNNFSKKLSSLNPSPKIYVLGVIITSKNWLAPYGKDHEPAHYQVEHD